MSWYNAKPTYCVVNPDVLKQADEWRKHRVNVATPSWDEIFMRHAFLSALKSRDAQTQVGAVLVEPIGKTILSSGYNGFVRGGRDTCIPNTRPSKYKFFIHAEHNALLNCARLGRSTEGSVCYCTHKPCEYCIQYLYQAGITEIVCVKNATTSLNKDIDKFYELFHFLTYNKMRIREMTKPDGV